MSYNGSCIVARGFSRRGVSWLQEPATGMDRLPVSSRRGNGTVLERLPVGCRFPMGRHMDGKHALGERHPLRAGTLTAGHRSCSTLVACVPLSISTYGKTIAAAEGMQS